MGAIKKPLITEKFTELGDKLNQYAFICDPKSTKEQIKKEVEKLYGVKVERINTMIYPGRKKSKYTKRNIIEGRKPRYKKAVVTLKESDSIDFYSSI